MKKEKQDKRSMGEKIDDGFDKAIGVVEDIVYGENPNFQNDIPATIQVGDGPRKVNKHQTRKNINKRIFGNKGAIGLFILLLIGGVICGIYYLIEYLLIK